MHEKTHGHGKKNCRLWWLSPLGRSSYFFPKKMRNQSGKKTAPINLITFKYTERENESERKIFQAERKNRKIHNVSKYFEVLSPVDFDVAPFHIVLTCEYERKKATHGTLTQSINTVIRLFTYSLFSHVSRIKNQIQFNSMATLFPVAN